MDINGYNWIILGAIGNTEQRHTHDEVAPRHQANIYVCDISLGLWWNLHTEIVPLTLFRKFAVVFYGPSLMVAIIANNAIGANNNIILKFAL